MNDEVLSRYSRHLLLAEIDMAGQEKLLRGRILVVGLGGLGSAAAMYLAGSGVGELVLCDDDEVDLANLQRQILHRTADIGRKKVLSARDTLAALNPTINIKTIDHRLDPEALGQQIADADAIIDASDNFPTRFLLNRLCLRHQTPLVSGAAIGFHGQITLIDPRQPHGPCYQCLYPDIDAVGDTCAQQGVFAPLVGMVGSLQAAEALKVLLGIGETLSGRLLLVDALTMAVRTSRYTKDTNCPACQAVAAD